MINTIELTAEDEAKYDEEYRKINEIFGDTDFTISIDCDELDELLTDKKQIIIKQDYNCYCYDAKINSKYYTICGNKLTLKYVLLELKRQGLKIDCNHHFIEGFIETKHSDCQFEIATGS